VRLAGANVVAASETPLPKDGFISVEVTDISDRITLRLLLSESMPATDGSARTDQMAQVLSNLNLSSDPQNIRIAMQLRRFGLPVTKENVHLIAQHISTSDAEAEAAAYLMSRGIPLSRETIDMAGAYLSEKAPLSNQIQATRAALAHVVDMLPEEARTHVAQLIERLDGLPLRIGEGNVSDRLLQFTRRLGLNMEARMLKIAGVVAEKDQTTQESGERSPRAGAPEMTYRLRKEQANPLRPGPHMSEARELSRCLKAQLLRVQAELRSELTGIEGDEKQATALSQAMRQVSGLLGHVVGQQIQGLDAQDGLCRLFYQIAFYIGDDLSPGQMRIAEEGGNGDAATRQGPKQFNVTLSLDMTSLGHVTAQCTFADKRVTCDLFVENEQSRDLLEGHLRDLRSALSDLGCAVTRADCHMGSIEVDPVGGGVPPPLDEMYEVDLVI